MNETTRKDMEILKQLYLCQHLSKEEKETAKQLLICMDRELKARV